MFFVLNSFYFVSKVGVDMFVSVYYEIFGMNVNIIRCLNNYGFYYFSEKLILLMVMNVLEGKEFFIYGDGKNVCDWLYVKDYCVVIDLVIYKGKLGEIYNVGGYNE